MCVVAILIYISSYKLAGPRALSLRRGTVAAVLLAAGADKTLMDGGLHTVVLLDVKLGQLVVLKDTGFLDVTGGGLVDDGTD